MSTLAGLAPRLASGGFRLVNVLLVALIAAGGGAAYLALRHSTGAAAPTVRTGTVTRGVVLQSVSATGNVIAQRQLSVGFQASGTVSAVDVKVGQHVGRSQVLGRIDPTIADEAVRTAQAALATARASLATAQAGETAAERKQDAISLKQATASVRSAKTAASDSTSAIASAQAGVATAQAAVAGARTTLAQDAKSARLSLATATRQQRADRGNEQAAVAQLKTDQTQVAADQATYNSAVATVTNDQSRVAADQSQQHVDQLRQDDVQAQQTIDAQNKDASAQDDDARQLATLTKSLAADAYQLSLDQSALTTDQQTASTASSAIATDKSAIESDRSSIVGYETKLVSDRDAIAEAHNSADATAAKDKQAIASAKQSVATARQGVTAARQSVATAKQSVASAKLSAAGAAAANEVKQAPPTASTLAQLRAAVLQAQVGLADAQRTLAQTVLRSPAAGTVSAVDGLVGGAESGGGVAAISSSSSSTGSSSAGSSSSSGFVTLVGLSSLEVQASFAESDAAKIAVGQAATVTVSALGAELPAHVASIDPSGSTSSSVVEYTVTFALDRANAGLKPGMTTTVAVTIGERDNVLQVPSSAVSGSGANARVTVVRDGARTRTPVVAGLEGDSTTEIVSGLKAGQSVVTSTGTAVASSGASTSEAGSRASLFRSGGGFGGGGFGGGARVFSSPSGP